MTVALVRMVLRKLGVPSLLRDSKGNASLSVDENDADVKLGKGKPTPITGSRALTAADDGLVLVNRTANPYVLTVPAGLPDGFSCSIIQKVALGAVSVVAGASATVGNSSNFTKTSGAKSMIGLVQEDTDSYILVGDGAA